MVLDGVYWCNCPEGSRGQNCEIPIRIAINDTFPSKYLSVSRLPVGLGKGYAR